MNRNRHFLTLIGFDSRLKYHRFTTRNPNLMPSEDPTTTKRHVILAIDDAWRRFRASFNELRSDQVLESGVCGEWSVNEVLWHISAWETLLIEALETPDDGYDYPEPDEDEFNAASVSQMNGASPRHVIERLESTHRKLRDRLANTPSSYFDLDHPRRRLIDEWAFLHYEEHAAQIGEWRSDKMSCASER